MARQMNWTAVVLAGSRPGRDFFAEQFATDLKPLIPVGGEPMVRRPVAALLQSASVRKVLVLSQSPERIAAVLQDDPRVEVRTSENTIADTLLRLIESGAEWPLLVTTADHALLDSATVEEFVAASAGADIAIGVVERQTLLQRFPQARRTWMKFRGGAFTGANLFALGSPKVRPAIELWRSVEQDRKKALRVISVLGPVPLIFTALRILSLDDVLAQLGSRLDMSIKAARLTNPLAGVDVDKPEDHALAEAVLAGRA